MVNELAKVARDTGLDLREAVAAAATKPFGFIEHVRTGLDVAIGPCEVSVPRPPGVVCALCRGSYSKQSQVPRSAAVFL
ncbi:hypothetical protein ABZ455_37405 [Streptomyces avermitilis]